MIIKTQVIDTLIFDSFKFTIFILLNSGYGIKRKRYYKFIYSVE